MNIYVSITPEYIYLGIWATIGSILGYFAFGDIGNNSPRERIKRCILSTAVGIFIAFPTFTYLIECHSFSPRLSMMLSGLGAFGLPDFLLKYYPKLLRSIAFRVTKQKADQYSNRNDSYE